MKSICQLKENIIILSEERDIYDFMRKCKYHWK